MHNAFVHVELQTEQQSAAKAFYSQLFNWQLKDETTLQGSHYTLIDVGQGTAGGIMQAPEPGAHAAWVPYVAVEDIQQCTDKARSLGAIVLQEIMVIPKYGAYSLIRDPAGALIGLWQSGQ